MAKKRTQIDEFLTAYWKAVDEGLTRDEFAQRIGVKVQTVYQRVYELNRGLKERGQSLPLLPTGGRRSVLDKAAELMGRLSGGRPQQEESLEDVEDPLADILG